MLTLLNCQNLICYVLRFEIQTRNDKHYATNEEQQNLSYYYNIVSCILVDIFVTWK